MRYTDFMIDSAPYKKALEEDLIQITSDLTDLGIHNPSVPEDWIATPSDIVDAEPDENIAADRSESWQERRSTVAALETRYNNINRALVKIEKGTYGICEVCGEEIETDRLDINPAARTDKTHINEESSLPK
jgi:RNA polymerase-binding transcription factor DksA